MGFTQELLQWFSTHGRILPWRDDPNPYHVWVSEVILQQTRVDQGTEYYHRFLANFPTISALANAPLDAVMKLWEGLGYYTRARNLHKAAQIVMGKYHGQLPNSYSALRTLPGLGDYAAGAVASFAFKEPVPAIDGNVYRVLARVYGIFESPGKAQGKKIFRELCLELIDKASPHRFNQALIDFGALQCTPGKPDCQVCPFLGECYAQQNALQLKLPTKERTLKIRPRHLNFLMLRHGNSTFIERREKKDIWHSLYQFPLIETTNDLTFAELAKLHDVQELLGQNYTLLCTSPVKHQLLSHQELFIHFYIIALHEPTYALRYRYRRVPIQDMHSYQVPISIRNYLVADEAARYFLHPDDEQ